MRHTRLRVHNSPTAHMACVTEKLYKHAELDESFPALRKYHSDRTERNIRGWLQQPYAREEKTNKQTKKTKKYNAWPLFTNDIQVPVQVTWIASNWQASLLFEQDIQSVLRSAKRACHFFYSNIRSL